MVVWWVAVVWCVVAAGVVVAVVRAVPPVSPPPVPADDPHVQMYCLSCNHTHARGGMEWNDELQFRCADCCSSRAMDRASLAIGHAYTVDYLLSPAVKAENAARLHREAAELNAVYWAERVREYQQQYPAIADRLGRRYPPQPDRAA